jgi:tetratricopeptide (TPR) repeat protein
MALCLVASIPLTGGARAHTGQSPEAMLAEMQRLNSEAVQLTNSGTRLPEAEEKLRAALAIGERIIEPEDRGLADLLKNLGVNLNAQGRPAEAERYLRRAVNIRQKKLGSTIETAQAVQQLGLSLYHQSRYDEACVLYQSALQIWRQNASGDLAGLGAILSDLGICLFQARRFAEAEAPLREAVEIAERRFGPASLVTAERLYGLTFELYALEKYSDAEVAVRRVINIYMQLDKANQRIPDAMENLAQILDAQGKKQEAAKVRQRATGP